MISKLIYMVSFENDDDINYKKYHCLIKSANSNMTMTVTTVIGCHIDYINHIIMIIK